MTRLETPQWYRLAGPRAALDKFWLNFHVTRDIWCIISVSMQDGHGGYLVRSGFPLPLRMFAKLAGVAVYPPCGLGHNHEDQETCGKFQAANDKAATMARVRDIVHDHIDYAFEDDKEALVKALVNAMCKKEGS